MLALMLLLHHATARDSPHEPHVIKNIASCPDVGYYFKRELAANALEPACFLCFCRDDGAVCWHRQLSRCDEQRYRHFGERKRVNRVRRSPGLADIFFRDSAKDILNLSPPQKCQPHESYSVGCPPDDWCVGCTVCDCDTNGRWNCHTLSFCDKGKKQKKSDKLPKRYAIKKSPTNATNVPSLITPMKGIKDRNNSIKTSKKQSVQRKQSILVKPQTKPQKEPIKSNGISVKKAKSPVFKKKPIPKSKGRPNNKILKKSSTNEIIKGKSKTINETEKIMRDMAHTIYKKVMASVEKIVKENQQIMTDGKNTRIGSILKQYKNDTNKKMNSTKSMEIKKSKPKNIKYNQPSYTKKNKRSKREIPTMITSKYYLNQANSTAALNITTTEESFIYQTLDNKFSISSPLHTVLTKPLYFKYTVDKGNNTRNFTAIQMEQFLIPQNITTANKQEVLPQNNFKEDIYEGKLLKTTSNDEGNMNFTIKLLNISDSVNINSNESISHDIQRNCSNIRLKMKTPYGKVCNFTKIFKKLFAFNNTNTIMSGPNKTKKNNLLKYLKRVIRKIFHKGKVIDANLRKKMEQNIAKCNLNTTLCNNFVDGNGQISSKIYKLRSESKKLMKSIINIKDLLKLFDIGTVQNKENTTHTTKQILNNDIEKINAIIQEKYDKYTMNSTRNIQVSYIKQNIEIFMQSLENFAEILNDIMKILTTGKMYSPKLLNSYIKNYVTQKPTKMNNKLKKNNYTVGEKLNKIKRLLVTYNLVQNNFINRMFDAIRSIEPMKNKTKIPKKSIIVSNETENNTEAIETYTKNIIENLKQLKNLVHKLNSKSRTKRQAMEDSDTVEYLLILMEYLLKQKNQLRISPVNDGIDLLIEAIRNVPDIKATKKKVLDSFPVQTEKETTQAVITLQKSTETADESNDTLKSVVAQLKTFESIDEDEESNDFYQYNRNNDKSNGIKLKGKFETEEIIYPTTTLTSNVYLAKGDENNIIEKKLDMKKGDDTKGYELFIDDTDDEDGVVLTTIKPPDVVRESVTFKKPLRTTPPANLRDEQTTSRDVNDSYGNHINRIKLDWVEESYNQDDERKEIPRFIETTTQKLTPTHTTSETVTRTFGKRKKVKLSKYDDPTSSISKETLDEDRKRNKNINSEYVMYKKQMDLLNSLDYGTEKIEIDVENLDSNEDKSNLEQFPLYFI